MPEPVATELFVGLVGPIGTDLDLLCTVLRDVLDNELAYKVEVIRLIDLVRELDQWKALPSRPSYDYYDRAMTAGDDFRDQLGRGDALALLAIRYLRDEVRGKGRDPNHPLPRQAYVFRSLKHPTEIETLRRTYGEAFLLIGAYAPKADRIDTLARKLSGSSSTTPTPEHRHSAEKLIDRDEDERGVRFGQAVRDAFPLADFFIDVSRPHDEIRDTLIRLVRLLFSYPYITPTRQEHGMFHAQAAALRSSAMGRQVGAALCTSDGDIISVGTNEVPKAFGGQYWGDEPVDKRDFQLGVDSNDDIKRQNLSEVLGRLQGGGWFNTSYTSLDLDDLVAKAEVALKGTRAMSPIEYGRAVHAELSALISAARRGASTQDSLLFTTTFPCHECARHIIAAGIKTVFYIEPYPKSLARDLHGDAVSIEEDSNRTKVTFLPFVGVAPRQYMRLFNMRTRKDPRTGKTVTWRSKEAMPVSVGPSRSYFETETWLGEELNSGMKDRQLTLAL